MSELSLLTHRRSRIPPTPSPSFPMTSTAVLWLIAGIVLVVAEFFVPVFVLVFFGMAALITGLAVFAGWPADPSVQFALFAGLSLALLFGLRRLAQRYFKGLTSDVADREPGFEDFIGRDAVVAVGFGPGARKGRVSYRGTDWDAESGDAVAPGDTVLITARSGSLLVVRKKTTAGILQP